MFFRAKNCQYKFFSYFCTGFSAKNLMENLYTYYYSNGVDKFGPYTLENIRSMNLMPNTLVWHDGLENWVTAASLPELRGFIHTMATPPPVPPQAPFRPTGPNTPYTPGNNPQRVTPVHNFRTHRGLFKYIIFSILTLGIHQIVVFSHISSEINTVAGRHDHRHTMHFCLVYFIFSWLTLGIYPLVWWSSICSRMGDELRYRRIPYSFGAGYFWGWGIFGSLIIVGPFIFYHKFFKAMNKLNKDYNVNG